MSTQRYLFSFQEKGDIDLAIRYYLVAIEVCACDILPSSILLVIELVLFILYALLQLRPNFADAWSNLASAYMRKGRLNEAAQCCRQALALNPLLVCCILVTLFV